MARVTVEDCLGKVANRFELVLLAAKRARQLAKGRDEAKVSWDGDKSTVVALREIAADKIDRDAIEHIENQEDVRMSHVARQEPEEHSEG